MEDMKWWWDRLTLARGAEAQATPHCIERWLKKNGWQPWFLLNSPGKVLDHRRTVRRHKQSNSLAQCFLEHLVSYNFLHHHHSGFGGLEAACWPLVPKFMGSHPAEAIGLFRQKNPQHAFLQRGSKAIGLMS